MPVLWSSVGIFCFLLSELRPAKNERSLDPHRTVVISQVLYNIPKMKTSSLAYR